MEEISRRMKPSSSRKIAFLSMRDLTGFYAYDHLCFPAMAERGWEGSEVAWDLPQLSSAQPGTTSGDTRNFVKFWSRSNDLAHCC